MKKGFELTISGNKYRVRCDTSIMTNTAEKISDFIRNCINGQDSCYWDWDEPNRHLKDKSE